MNLRSLSTAPGNAGTSTSSSHLLLRRPTPCRRSLAVSSRSNRGGNDPLLGGLDPNLEIAVPRDQRPVNELAQLRTSQLFSWATLQPTDYLARLGTLWLGLFALLGAPIANQTFDPLQQPLLFFLSGATGALVVVALATLRIYLGWNYVGNRLLSASIEYEETGWYDGQRFVKPPEVLARDRLLGTYEVGPVLRKLKNTLLGAGGALTVMSLSLTLAMSSARDADGMVGRGAARAVRTGSDGTLLFSSRVQDASQLFEDDELAAEEAAAMQGIPGFCMDRFHKAIAGEDKCRGFE